MVVLVGTSIAKALMEHAAETIRAIQVLMIFSCALCPPFHNDNSGNNNCGRNAVNQLFHAVASL